MADFDDDEDAMVDDPNEPDESDWDDDEGDQTAETIPCPHCGRDVYEQAEVCPGCGKFISREDTKYRAPLWIWIGAVACLIVVVLFWVLSRNS